MTSDLAEPEPAFPGAVHVNMTDEFAARALEYVNSDNDVVWTAVEDVWLVPTDDPSFRWTTIHGATADTWVRLHCVTTPEHDMTAHDEFWAWMTAGGFPEPDVEWGEQDQ